MTKVAEPLTHQTLLLFACSIFTYEIKTMKKLLILLPCVLLFPTFLFGQNKAETPKKEDVEKWLPGTWAVLDAKKLPKQADTAKIFLMDTVFFTEPGDSVLTNTHNNLEQVKIYQYNDDSGMLTIFNVYGNDGMMYEIGSLSETRLVFWVPNENGTDFTELVYTKVKKK